MDVACTCISAYLAAVFAVFLVFHSLHVSSFTCVYRFLTRDYFLFIHASLFSFRWGFLGYILLICSSILRMDNNSLATTNSSMSAVLMNLAISRKINRNANNPISTQCL
jgi:hypothetical protein